VLYSHSSLPSLYRANQKLVSKKIFDIQKALSAEFSKLDIGSRIKPGDKVAITAGSRGIANITKILAETIRFCKSIEARPFVVPAMGSHGGATAEGQVQILEKLGINEDAVDAPIKATMEVKEIGVTQPYDIKVYIDQYAFEADHIIPINRIKPHTKYKGDIESGLCKMMNIGLGKYYGAQYYHHCALAYGFPEVLESVSRVIMTEKNIPFGVAIVEDGYDQTAIVEAIPGDLIIQREKELLKTAKEYIPRLPFPDIDFLIIDWMGKEISGAGMDSNVTGRNRDIMKKWHSDQKIKRLFVRDLTPSSIGNGIGIGMADFTTKRLVERLDLKKTYINGFSTCYPEVIMIPPHFETDGEAVEACMNTIGQYNPRDLKIIWIRDTAHLDDICISQALAREAMNRHDLQVIDPPFVFPFNGEGNLVSPFDGY